MSQRSDQKACKVECAHVYRMGRWRANKDHAAAKKFADEQGRWLSDRIGSDENSQNFTMR